MNKVYDRETIITIDTILFYIGTLLVTFKLHEVGYEACIAMPHRPSSASISLCMRMYPSSPHPVPHEFFTSQYWVPSTLVP